MKFVVGEPNHFRLIQPMDQKTSWCVERGAKWTRVLPKCRPAGDLVELERRVMHGITA